MTITSASKKRNQYKSASTRFISNLPTRSYCTNDFAAGLLIRRKKDAIRYEYIQLNRKLRFYLPFDIDREGAAFAHEDAGLPAPTIIIINRENAHAHLLYELKSPVAFKDYNGNGKARYAPIRYYEALMRGMAERLDADRSYSQLICKNPRHKR